MHVSIKSVMASSSAPEGFSSAFSGSSSGLKDFQHFAYSQCELSCESSALISM